MKEEYSAAKLKSRKKNFLYNPLAGNFISWFLAFCIIMPYANGWTDNPILFPIALFVGSFWTIWLHSFQESKRIATKNWIDHSDRLIIRSVIAIAIGLATHYLSKTDRPLMEGFTAAIYLGTIFWLEFDFILNYHRGLKWDYRSKDPNAAETDKLFAEKKIWWLTSKVVLFLLGLLLYYRILIG